MKGWKRVALTVAAVLAAGLVAGPTVARHVVHRSDSDAFQSYVQTYVAGWWSSRDPGGAERDEAWVLANPDEVLAEGRAACTWLQDRPDAPSEDPEHAFDSGSLTSRYLHEQPESAAPGVSEMGRRTIVSGAWEYLCWWDRREKTVPFQDAD